ncbi:MAG: hypothetical protein KAJ97_09920 [Acidobacteria bacterium]|nr:hypothetical protein [Acidobacteriota bacterium]
MEILKFEIVGDPRELIVSQCVWCAHRSADGASCQAFPNGIPYEILFNEHDHTTPFAGDSGTCYEPVMLVLEEEKVPA